MSEPSPTAVHHHPWIGLAVLSLPTLLLSVDNSVLYLALPELSADLAASGIEQLWIMDAYSFLLAGFLITMGNLGDRIGRRRLLLIGAALFGLASVCAAYATSPESLIVLRGLMGLAGATLMPSTLALISNMFPDARQRGMAIGIWASCMMVGAAAGPAIGGLLLQHFWWGSIFLMGVPVMLLLLALGPFLLPEFRTGEGRLDLVSVLLSLVAILPAVYGLKEIAVDGFAPTAAVALAVGLASGWLFVRRQRHLADPLLDLTLVRRTGLAAALSIIVLGGIPLSGVYLLASQQLQLVLEQPPARTGLLLAPIGIAVAVSAMAAQVFVRRFRVGSIIAVGLVISAAGFVSLVAADGVVSLVASLVAIYLGVGPSMALGVDLVVGSAPKEKAGSAAAMSESGTELSIALGIALLGSLGTAVYRNQLSGVPAEAEHGLAGAVDIASRMPAAEAAALVDKAREAFTSGLQAGAWCGAAVFMISAVIAVTGLRQPTGEDEQVTARPGRRG